LPGNPEGKYQLEDGGNVHRDAPEQGIEHKKYYAGCAPHGAGEKLQHDRFSIQLGSVMSIKHYIDHFVVCDKKLIQAAASEGLKVVNPN